MTKPVLISLSVLSALTFSACGKSSDNKTAPITAVETTGRRSPTPPKQATGAPTPGSPTGSANTPVAEISPNEPVVPTNPNSENGITVLEQTDSSGRPLNPVGGNHLGPNQNHPTILPIKPGGAASDLKFDETQAVKTGGRAGDLFYTSASGDGLMTEFKLKSKTVSADQQNKNQKLASAISAAKLRRLSTGEMSIDLAIVEPDQKVHSYTLRAVVDGQKMKLSAVTSGGDLEFQGGFLKCLDSDGGCQTSYAKIKFSNAYTRIIFRTSYADSHFMIYTNPASSRNSYFELWNSYISNQTDGIQNLQKLNRVQVSSFEIVNGKSAMGVLISAEDQESVGLSLGLLALEKGVHVVAPVAKHVDISKSYDLKVPVSRGQKLNQALVDAKLVANNGAGQLKLMFTFSADVTDSKIWLNLSRIEKPTMTLPDVQKFEATVPNF